MQVVSVNVGKPRTVAWKGDIVETAIFKHAVSGAVPIRTLNLDGDQQANLVVHGGRNKAVYGYPSEHYEYWRAQMPDTTFSWGAFGENLTTSGLTEESLYIGDQLRVGSAVLQVVQPRMPCFKLNIRLDRDDMIKRFLHSRRVGFYFSVLEEGTVEAGSPIEVLSPDTQQVKVVDVFDLYMGNNRDEKLLARALRVEALPDHWKSELEFRATRVQGRSAG